MALELVFECPQTIGKLPNRAIGKASGRVLWLVAGMRIQSIDHP